MYISPARFMELQKQHPLLSFLIAQDLDSWPGSYAQRVCWHMLQEPEAQRDAGTHEEMLPEYFRSWNAKTQKEASRTRLGRQLMPCSIQAVTSGQIDFWSAGRFCARRYVIMARHQQGVCHAGKPPAQSACRVMSNYPWRT